jgi:hypothetical protein
MLGKSLYFYHTIKGKIIFDYLVKTATNITDLQHFGLGIQQDVDRSQCAPPRQRRKSPTSPQAHQRSIRVIEQIAIRLIEHNPRRTRTRDRLSVGSTIDLLIVANLLRSMVIDRVYRESTSTRSIFKKLLKPLVAKPLEDSQHS